MNINFLKVTLLVIVCLLTIATSFAQKKLLILGSSTSACTGPTNPANCYVNRLANYYNTPTPTLSIENRAASGFNVYKSMPRTYKPPAGRDTSLPYYSITDALAANPDVILVNYPTNNYEVYSTAEVMFCLRTIKAEANKAGKPCFITTTQPRTGFDAAGREKLRILKDSILNQFGPSAIDFWTGLADSATLAIAAPYAVTGDPIHLNDAAHDILFQRVAAKKIISALLPDAGPDLNLTLPYGGFLDGKNSTASSPIVSYNWTKISGPEPYNLTNPNAVGTYLNSVTAGSYTFRLTVKNDKGETASDEVVVNVKDGGSSSPPVAQAGADINITLPTNSLVLDGSKSTAPGSTITNYTWSWVSGPAAYSIITPLSNSTAIKDLIQGVYTFRLTVMNGSGQRSTDDVVVTVNSSINTAQAPVADAGKDETIPEGQATVLHGEKSTAPGSAIKSYFWTRNTGPSNCEILTPYAATTWIRNMSAGTYVYRLTITTTDGASAYDDVVITVTGSGGTTPVPPQTPVAQAGPDVSINLPLTAVTLDGSNSSAPGSFITKYNWSYISGPTAFNISTPAAVKTEVRDLVTGVYTFRLTITTNGGTTASDDVIINVQPASTNAPVANAGKDETIPVGQATVLHGEASTAPAGSIKSYSWIKFSGPSSYEMLTPYSATTWIRKLTAGIYVFRLTITDSNGVSSFDDVVITVTAVNLPVAAAGPDLQVTSPISTVVLDGSKSTTPSGVITSYYWQYVSGPLGSTIAKSDSSVTIASGLVQGTYTFRLTVTNSLGGKSSDDVLITVSSGVILKPVFTTVADAGKDETIPIGQATVLHGENSSAPGGKIVSYEWSKYSGPATYEMLTPSAAATWIRNMMAGTYVYRLTVTDDKGNRAIDDVVITVTAITTSITKSSKFTADGTVPITNNSGLTFYPNPAINHLNLQFSHAAKGAGKILIVDGSGITTRMWGIVKDQNSFNKKLDLTGIRQGSYSIEIVIKNKLVATGKFFKY